MISLTDPAWDGAVSKGGFCRRPARSVARFPCHTLTAVVWAGTRSRAHGMAAGVHGFVFGW